jgi:hypothetical protein
VKRSLVIFGLYVLPALGFTFPLALNLSTGAPAGEAWTYDGFSLLWNLWWFKHALLVLNANPFVTNSIFAPLGADLYLHTFTLFSDLSALPLLAWLSPVAANNLILIVSLALCGYGMHLLASFLFIDLRFKIGESGSQALARERRPSSNKQQATISLQSDGAAFVAGIVFAFTTSTFMYLALGHLNFVTTQWLPFYMLYLLKAVRRPDRRVVFMAALFLALALLVEPSLAMLLVLVTAFFALGKLVLSREPLARRIAGLAPVAAILAVAGVMGLPYLLPALREAFDPRYIPQYWGGAAVFSADLVGLFVPSSLHTFFGSHDWPREWQQALENKARFVDVHIFVIGFGVLGMALLGAAAQRRFRRWLWLALALVVLSLGPILHINGQSTFNLDGMKVIAGMPYIVLHYIPVLNGLRVPQRFSVVAMLCFGVLAGAGAYWVLGRSRSHVAQALLLALMIVLVSVEHILVPIPLADARVPSIYDTIAQEAGDFTIMDIPLGWRSGFGPIGTENTQLQYYQVVHGKRLISGFAARTPSFIFDYFKRQPILNAIATLESEGRLPPDANARDPALAAELAYFYDLRYILIHPPAAAPTPYDATRQRVLDYIRSVFDIDEVSRADGIIVYRVNQLAPRAGLVIDFGTDASSLNRAEGWDANEVIGGATANWMTAREARFFAPLRAEGNYRLTIRAMPFVYPGHPGQTLTVQINGRTVGGPLTLADEWGEYTINIPNGELRPGLDEIVCTASEAAAPVEVLPGSTDTRRLSVAVDWVRLEAAGSTY